MYGELNQLNAKNNSRKDGAKYIMSDYVLGIGPYKDGDEDFNATS